MRCEDLLRDLNDHLDGVTRATFVRHLASCDPCRVVVDNIRGTITLYRGEELHELPPELAGRLHVRLRERWHEIRGGSSPTWAEKGMTMLYSVDTKKPIEKIREDLTKACAAHKFGVLGVHDLKAKMREKGVEYAGECLVFEVCNPQKAKEVLEKNPDVATALPCRVSVYRTAEGKTRIATLRPTKLIAVFGTPELQAVAAEVEATLKSIMDEAAR